MAALPRANIIEIVQVNVKTNGVKAHGMLTKQHATAIGIGNESFPTSNEAAAPKQYDEINLYFCKL